MHYSGQLDKGMPAEGSSISPTVEPSVSLDSGEAGRDGYIVPSICGRRRYLCQGSNRRDPLRSGSGRVENGE